MDDLNERATKREAVRNLQIYLRQVAYGMETPIFPPVDGIFDTETERAVKNFQKEEGLEETGRADRETWDKVYVAYNASLAKNSSPLPICIFPRFPEDADFGVGDGGFSVFAIQYMLGELTRDYEFPAEAKITGSYDGATERAVAVFQRQNGLNGTGRVDTATWNELADQSNLLHNCFPQQ